MSRLREDLFNLSELGSLIIVFKERNCEMLIKAVLVHGSLIALFFWLATRRDSQIEQWSMGGRRKRRGSRRRIKSLAWIFYESHIKDLTVCSMNYYYNVLLL